jgi:hypothetical protein
MMAVPKPLRRLISGLALLAGSGGAFAAVVVDLYEAQVAVQDRSDEARRQGEIDALSAVLVKLTGRAEANASELSISGAQAVRNLVEQFSYRSPAPSAPGADKSGADKSGAVKQLLVVRFDPVALGALVSNAGVSVWPRTRPLTFIALGVDESGARRLLSADDSGLIALALREVASARGLPIAVPLMDLRDQRAMGPADVWGGFFDRINAVATRYRAEAAVFGTAEATGNDLWRAEWALRVGSEAHAWSADGLDAHALSTRIIGSVVEVIAASFTTAAENATSMPSDSRLHVDGSVDGNGLDMIIDGVTDAGRYGSLMAYLRSLDGVMRVDVVSLGADRAVVSVHTSGPVSSLRRLLDIGGTLSLSRDGERPEYQLMR